MPCRRDVRLRYVQFVLLLISNEIELCPTSARTCALPSVTISSQRVRRGSTQHPPCEIYGLAFTAIAAWRVDISHTGCHVRENLKFKRQGRMSQKI